jgi:hypothetical protein
LGDPAVTDPRELAQDFLDMSEDYEIQTLARELLVALDRLDNFERHVEREVEPKLLAQVEEFWRGFRDYWSSEQITSRMDEWTARTRKQLGMDPDGKVEARRKARVAKRENG